MPYRPGEWFRTQFDRFTAKVNSGLRRSQRNQGEVPAVNPFALVPSDESETSIVPQTHQDFIRDLMHDLKPTPEEVSTIIHAAELRIRRILSPQKVVTSETPADTFQEFARAVSRDDAGKINSLVDVMKVQARPLEASERFTGVLIPFDTYQREREGKSTSGDSKPFDNNAGRALTVEEYTRKALEGLLEVRDLIKSGVFNGDRITIDNRRDSVAIIKDGNIVKLLPGLVSPVIYMLYVFVSGENYQKEPLASQQQAEEVLDTVILPTFLQLATNAVDNTNLVLPPLTQEKFDLDIG
jgi:hypothetical protein